MLEVEPSRRPGLVYAAAAGLFAVGLAGGFYCGFAYRGAVLPAPVASAAPVAQPGGGPGARGRPVVSGRVVSASASAIVVHDNATDTDVKVTLAPGAQVTRTQPVVIKPASLTTADNVVVSGQAQPDGSVRATSVTVGGFRGFQVGP